MTAFVAFDYLRKHVKSLEVVNWFQKRVAESLLLFINGSKVNRNKKNLQIAAENNDVEMIHALLKKLVKGYQPEEKIVDWVYRE